MYIGTFHKLTQTVVKNSSFKYLFDSELLNLYIPMHLGGTLLIHHTSQLICLLNLMYLPLSCMFSTSESHSEAPENTDSPFSENWNIGLVTRFSEMFPAQHVYIKE